MLSQNSRIGRSQSITIARKEFLEIFRDRRTLISVVLGPLIATPALFALLGMFINAQTEKRQTEIYKIGVAGVTGDSALLRWLRPAPNLRVTTISLAEAEAAVKERRLNAAAVLPEDTDARLAAGRAIPVKILLDEGNETSQAASQRLTATLHTVSERIVAQRLQANHLLPEYATPFHVTETPIAAGGHRGNLLLSMMLPYILVISTFSGAIYAAFDQVAGEKERGTLETLLVAPVSRRDIVLGKFGAVAGVCLVSALLTCLGLGIAFSSRSAGMRWLSEGGLHLTPMAVGVTLLVLLPLAILFAGLLLAVSTFARNQKEAQTYLAPLFMAVLVPAMMSMFSGAESGRTMALIPILGASIIIKQGLSGAYDPVFIGLAFAASVVYAGLALLFATRLFQHESVLIKA